MNFGRGFWRLPTVLLLTITAVQFTWSQPSVTIEPTTLTQIVGESFTYTLHISGINGLLASHVTLTFDNTVIQYTGQATPAGFFPSTNSGNGFFASNPQPGAGVTSVTIDQSVIGGPTLSGSGDLFTLGFTAIGPGSINVGITVSMRDSLNQTIPTVAIGASLNVNNPLPATTGISPSVVTAGNPDLGLTVNGTGFVQGVSVVEFDGSPVPTVFVSSTQLSATIPAVSLTLAGAKSITVFNPAPGGGTSNAETLTVEPASVHHFDFDAISSPQTAGAAFTFTITAKDPYGNTATSFDGVVNLTTTAGIVSPSVSGIFSSGTRTENVTVTLAGLGRTISADDGSGHSGTSGLFDVVPGPASKLVFGQEPTNAIAGATIAPAVTVRIEDVNGNVVNDNTTTVSLAIGTNPGSGTLTGGGSVAAVNGVATFSGLSINKAGTGYTLDASSVPALTAATSTAFNITAGSASKLVFGQQPTNATAGETITPAVTIRIEDTNGNLVEDNTTTVSLAISTNPGSGTLTGGGSVTAVNGVATFSGLSINKAGTGYTLDASSAPALTAATSTAFNIAPGEGSKILVETAADGSGSVVGSQSLPSGSSVTAYAIARDSLDNFVANVAASWSLTKTGGVVDGDLVPMNGGMSAVFTAHVIGTAVMHASFNGYAETPSGLVTVTYGPLTTFAVEATGGGPIGAQVQGTPFDIKVTAKDGSGNTVADFNETVDITSSGTLSTGAGSVALANGVLPSHSVTVVSTGATTISATRTNGGTPTGTSNSFEVAAASFTIHASAGTNGSIVPSGDVVVAYGATPSFTMTGAANYHLGALLVDGVRVNPESPYVFGQVTADHTIHAQFAQTQYTIDQTGLYSFDTDGDGTIDMTMEFSVLPYGGGHVSVYVYMSAPAGEALGPAGSLGYYAVLITDMPDHSFRVTVKSDLVNVAGFGSTSNLVHYRNASPAGWVLMPSTYAANDPSFAGHQSLTFSTDHFSNFTLFNAPSKNMFMSLNGTAAAQGTLFPNNTWVTGGYGADDWSWTGSQAFSYYLVPELNSVFDSGDVTLEWDSTVVAYASAEFSGLSIETATVTPVGGSKLHIHFANATDITVNPLNYIAKVNFTLLRPGHSAIAVVQSDFTKAAPPSNVYMIPYQGEVKTYLGDFATGFDATTGDGVIDFNDLSLWAFSYWSGVPGYPDSMANYKRKYDIGPTQDGFIFSLPQSDSKIDFEDLVIFSISYGQSHAHQLPKVAVKAQDPVEVSIGGPVQFGNETRLPLKLGGSVADVRAITIEVDGAFDSFLGAEKGELLNSYETPVMVMSRATGRKVFVDIAVMGLDVQGISRSGNLVWLRFAGRSVITLTNVDARNSHNGMLAVRKGRGEGDVMPTTYALQQNYPNPFNPSTTIEYAVPMPGNVKLEVYNIIGARVATLVDEVQDAGTYRIVWDGKDENHNPLATGVYLYRINAGEFNSVKKMMFLK